MRIWFRQPISQTDYKMILELMTSKSLSAWKDNAKQRAPLQNWWTWYQNSFLLCQIQTLITWTEKNIYVRDTMIINDKSCYKHYMEPDSGEIQESQLPTPIYSRLARRLIAPQIRELHWTVMKQHKRQDNSRINNIRNSCSLWQLHVWCDEKDQKCRSRFGKFERNFWISYHPKRIQ